MLRRTLTGTPPGTNLSPEAKKRIVQRLQATRDE